MLVIFNDGGRPFAINMDNVESIYPLYYDKSKTVIQFSREGNNTHVFNLHFDDVIAKIKETKNYE